MVSDDLGTGTPVFRQSRDADAIDATNLGVMNDNDIKPLSAEINRLLSSPYRVGLKKLFDILHDTSQHALQVWARGNPCQIDGLAAVVLDDVDLAPFSLDIIRIVSYAAPFRDAILERKPMLIDSLLAAATASDSGLVKYAAACTALLSAPLNIPEPAILPTFLNRILERAAHAPSADSIRPIYILLSGLTLNSLDTLPIDLLVHLQEQLVKLIVVPGSDDHSANLICLAILAKLATARRENFLPLDRPLASDRRSSSPDSSLNSDHPGPQLVDRYSTARQFFTVKRSIKTVGLVTLKAIQACSPSYPLDEAIEILEISEEIVDAMSSGEKRSWLVNSDPVVHRLYQRVLRQDIAIRVKCAALSFIAKLMEGEVLPSELIAAFEGLLNTSVSFRKAKKAVENFVTQFNESSICAIICNLLELSCSEVIPSSKSLVRLDNAIVLTSGLATRIQDSAALRQAILHSLSTNRLSEPLHQFLGLRSLVSTFTLHEQLENCPHSYQQTQMDLHQRICNLFLKTALYASQDEVSIDALMAGALLDKQTSFASISRSCNFYKPGQMDLATRHISSHEASPLESVGSCGWRGTLRESMFSAAESQHQSIIRIVGEICEDLELRCEDLERPLHDEQLRSNSLDKSLKASEAKLKELDSQAQGRILVLEELEAERVRLIEEAQAAEHRAELLSHKHELLQQEIDRAKQEAVSAAETAKEAMKRQELAHLAIMTGKDEMYDERTSTLEDLEDRMTHLTADLEQMRVQDEEANDRITFLQTEAREKNEALEEAKHSINSLGAEVHEKTEALEKLTLLAISRQSEIDRLVGIEAHALIDRQGLYSKLKESEDHCELLKVELDAKTADFGIQTADLRRTHDECLAIKAKEVEQQQKLSENAIQKLRVRLNKAVKDSTLAAKQSGQKIARLEKEILVLRHDQEQRAKEFAEAQDLSSRLMAVMGIKQHLQASSNPPTGEAREGPDFQETHTPFIPPFDSQIMRSSGSSTPSTKGPNPKRTRTQRKELKSPIFHRAKVVVVDTAGGHTNRKSAIKGRLPLRDLGDGTQNAHVRTPFQPLLRKPDRIQENERIEKENREIDSNVNLDEESFADGDIFTSTNQQRISGWRQTNTPNFDDTTVDF